MGSARRYRLLGPDGRVYESDVPGALGGNRSTKIYGRLDCPTAARHIANGGYVANRVFFADEETARAAGYRPCSHCLPHEYAAWKRAG
jgi:methylphosphotriester-DNA--protein-cysteine methyltransferase